jgi:hypothetical protein
MAKQKRQTDSGGKQKPQDTKDQWISPTKEKKKVNESI